MDELKPCPFCGEKVRKVKAPLMGTIMFVCDKCVHYHWYYDWCDKYDAEVKGEAVYDCFERKEE